MSKELDSGAAGVGGSVDEHAYNYLEIEKADQIYRPKEEEQYDHVAVGDFKATQDGSHCTNNVNSDGDEGVYDQGIPGEYDEFRKPAGDIGAATDTYDTMAGIRTNQIEIYSHVTIPETGQRDDLGDYDTMNHTDLS